ncbi:MAG: DNA repair exonuclease [Candidatus Coatesbacteria bacterium]|nr:DNA repair exonuclease [Candidatus Coatesbacteria bacterium]
MLKFVHAADLHLDSPFVGLSEDEPQIRRLLLEATFKAFDNAIDLCLAENVDFLLVAGDVYDGKDTLRAQLRFRDGLKRLSDAGIRSYVVHGNHDPLDSRKTSLQWPTLAVIFGGAKVESALYERGGEPAAIIHGISFKRTEVRDNLALAFKRLDSPLFQIGLLHCNVGTNTGHEPYAPCSRADLETAGLDYWALGHVHKMQVLKEHDPCIMYSGNTQGRHVNEAGPRGCFLVSVDEGGQIESQFVATDFVRWHRAELSIAAITDVDGLLDGLQKCLLDVQGASDGRPAICRLAITGRGSMHAELRKPGRLDEYMAEARGFGATLSPLVWLAELELKTSAEIDIERRMESQDIVGDCLRLIRDLQFDETNRAGAIHESPLTQCLKDLLNHHGMGKYLEPLDGEALKEMLKSTQSLLLDELVEESE